MVRDENLKSFANITVDEASLLEKQDGKANYEVILDDETLLKALSKKYKDYGCEIKNVDIKNAFLKKLEEKKDSEDLKNLCEAFSINLEEKPKTEEAKAATTNNAAETTKTNEVPKDVKDDKEKKEEDATQNNQAPENTGAEGGNVAEEK